MNLERTRRQAETPGRVAFDVAARFGYEQLRALAATGQYFQTALHRRRQEDNDRASQDIPYVHGWFDRYHGKLGERAYTFRMAITWFLQHGGKYIVETGSLREPGNCLGTGCSTVLFGEILERCGGHLWTCDISEQVIATAQQQTERFRDHITYVCGDSVAFLTAFDNGIDLLYLDSMDCPRRGDATEAQLHNLRELRAAMPALTEHAVVLLDDNRFRNGGKTSLSKQHLRDEGWICLFDWHQSLWTRRHACGVARPSLVTREPDAAHALEQNGSSV